MLAILMVILFIYVIYDLATLVVLFDEVKNFLKYEAPAEIAVVKKEFNIKNKIFDHLAVTAFLLTLPITYLKWKEC